MALDWSSIRPLNGGRDKGFEELCAQLARAEIPAGFEFVRKGTPDAGLECYATLPDQSEWGWQAKYFDGLGDSQFAQLDESVRTAIEKHPRLVRYIVCVPVDRADGRISKRKSAKERWDEHVAKWIDWASAKGMTIDFVYWGSHELLERLALPQHVGRVRFWFDVCGFDGAWFSARLEEALRTAGPRYTPEIHVDLPIALDFEAFGRTGRFFDRVKAHARTIRERLWGGGWSELDAAEGSIQTAAEAVSSMVQGILASLGAVARQPTGDLSFNVLAKELRDAEMAAETLAMLLLERERELYIKSKSTSETEPDPAIQRNQNPFRSRRIGLIDLKDELSRARESLVRAETIAGRVLMVLRGAAGTGKTHLLCDVARQRVAAGLPTVLLMGQRFVSKDAPWSQALQQLDLGGVTAEEFVGAFEAAAQAAGARALLLIDAINEGTGRVIWPSHLEAFLAHVERSPWIAVVLSVRSSYEEIVVPAGVRSRAAAVTHQGFMDHEYDATKTFFLHYGLELPSTPLLSPEFRNPLFLKTLCKGLNAKGERRLPRGFQGITAVFDLYLDAVNERLSSALDFDRRTPLVRQALEALSGMFLDAGDPWLPLNKAAEVVNSLLPGRGFERSLYRGLVAEGVVVEEVVSGREAKTDEVVFVAYERLADHLAANTLLDRHLDPGEPAAAFAEEGPLAFICAEKSYISPGLLEALCIQVPERTGQELSAIAPACRGRWGLGDAFRQSLVWRASDSFSDGTREALRMFCRTEHDVDDTLDVLLTVATLPEHPLNALYLHERLMDFGLPDRDAWWSVYLHKAGSGYGAIQRLVDWASSVTQATLIEDPTVDLCAISLAWILSTSNRSLRDRATKALVSLLTGRPEAVVRLVETFHKVDDPYVAERIYAVAYGVAMRCQDPPSVGTLAECVYGLVFAAGSPPPHILLRDYARGVVERALYLGSAVGVDVGRIRPPYKSPWPSIPTEDDIRPLLPDWSRGSHDSGELDWGRNRIGSSVMDDDFARYVIGTNFSSTSTHWLSLTLDESPWEPAQSRGEADSPPRFELRQIQRYVLWRVFDLGWTIERFGHFDRFSVGPDSGDVGAPRAERIGKKYQWIAYHEILALVSDHFQFREQFREEEGDKVYNGPWQVGVRDLDPSCTLRTVPGGTSWHTHAPAWWGATQYDAWGDPGRPKDWVLACADLPRIEELLVATNSADGSRWLSGECYFNWRQRPPADKEAGEVERRGIWFSCYGYLIRADDAASFLVWAEGVNFWGRWMPDAAEVYRMFLGEHAWAASSSHFGQPYYGDDGWVQPGQGCPAKIRSLALVYRCESRTFDCSIDESYGLRLPVSELVEGLRIRWSGNAADFVDGEDRLAAQDPTAHADGPTALLIREDLLREFMDRNKLTMCWGVIGEKRVQPAGFGSRSTLPALRMSGAYALSAGMPVGFLKCMLADPGAADPSNLEVLSIVRSSS